MIVDDKLWHVCFAAGEDGRYNELVEADCPATAIAMVKKRHSDWRADAPFTISTVRIIFGRVVESDPMDTTRLPRRHEVQISRRSPIQPRNGEAFLCLL